MDIFIGAFGSTGDLVPRVCLARSLQERGHRVTVGCVEEFRNTVESSDLTWAPLGVYPPPRERNDVFKRVMRNPDPSYRGEALLETMFLPMLPILRRQLAEL